MSWAPATGISPWKWKTSTRRARTFAAVAARSPANRGRCCMAAASWLSSRIRTVTRSSCCHRRVKTERNHASKKKPRFRGFFLEVEVELVELLLQATFLEQVVDDPALGQVGLGHFHRGLCGIVFILTDEVVFNLDIFFLGHLSSLHG